MSAPLPRRAFLGAGVRERASAVEVTRVLAGSPAERAGLRPGDVLVSLDGSALRSVADLTTQLRTRPFEAELRARRGEVDRALRVRLDEAPRETLPGAHVRYGHACWRGHRLRTIATLPKRAALPAPFVLFAQGLYCHSIELTPESPMTSLLRGWTERGLATLRVERPGVGDSEGPHCAELDLDDERAILEAALQSAGEHDLDPSRACLFGHSLGGTLAPLLVERVRAIAAYGACGARWRDVTRESLRRQLALRGASEAAIALRLARFDADPFEERHGRSLALHRQLDALDIGAAWAGVRVPLLVVIGEHDWVSGAKAQHAIREHAPNAELLELPGLDHAFTSHPSLDASLRAYGRGAFDERLASETARFFLREVGARTGRE